MSFYRKDEHFELSRMVILPKLVLDQTLHDYFSPRRIPSG